MTDPRTFWGLLKPEEGETLLGRAGHLHIRLEREDQEYLVSWRHEEPTEQGIAPWHPVENEEKSWEQSRRFGFEEAPETLHIVPRLPDRPLVVQPTTELAIPGGQELTVYVATPLWVEIRSRTPDVPMLDQPVEWPRSTWFGPNTRTGELCYAAQTRARLNLHNVSVRRDRAVTQISVRNQTRGPFSFSRLKLPLPQLSLYSADEWLWTEPALLVIEEGRELAELRTGAASQWLEGKERVSEPREPVRSTLTRAFGALLEATGVTS